MSKTLWVAFFSQTGSEIADISSKINRWPDLICTNKPLPDIDKIDYRIVSNLFNKILFLNDRPTLQEYTTALNFLKKERTDYIITLHGYLRIVPPAVCDKFVIYNGHPGDIVSYPILKGFNPQEKAFNLKYKKSGSVIHRVTSVLDGGEVLKSKKCKIDTTSLDNTYTLLKANSLELWVDFLTKEFNINK